MQNPLSWIQPFKSLLLPLILTAAALSLQPQLAVLSLAQQEMLALSPLLALALVGLLAWRFNRSRLVFLALLLALLFFSLGLDWPAPQLARLVEGAWILLAFNLLWLGLSQDRGILTVHGNLRSLFLIAQLSGLGWLLQQRPDLLDLWLRQPWLPLPASVLPANVALSVGLAIFGLLLHQRLRRGAFSGAFIGVLVLTSLSLHQATDLQAASLYFSAAALLLLIALIQESYGMAYLDQLTGLPGRRALQEDLNKLAGQYSIAMADVDHFKQFNDTHGHDVGDQVLRRVAAQLMKVSGGGKAYRYGGEEFCIVFAGRDLHDAIPQLEAIRSRIADTPFVIRSQDRPKKAPKQRPKRSRRKQHTSVQITISLGAAQRSGDNNKPELVIKAADQALYRAKQKGRNRVCK